MRHLRLGLLGRFTLASVVPLVGLALLLGHTLSAQIRDRAVLAATTQTRLMADLCLTPLVSAESLAEGFTPEGRNRLDDEVRTLVSMDVARVSVMDRTGRIAYANDASLVGTTPAMTAELGGALDGTVGSTRMRQPNGADHDEMAGDLLAVYVPLRATGHDEAHETSEPTQGSSSAATPSAVPEETPPASDEHVVNISQEAPTAEAPIGALAVSIPYGPIDEAVASDVHTLWLYLAGGLLVLYLALASILLRARRHEYFALHDSLTGLANRVSFRDRVRAALRARQRDGAQAAVMILDLDRFKNVNDTLGHSSGDVLLSQVSSRLITRLGASGTIARLGGDEFAVLLPVVTDKAAAGRVAETLLATFDEPFVVDGIRLDIRASIGIAMVPIDGADVEAIVRRADVAMYTAKAARSGLSYYSSALDRNSAATLMLVGELRRAIRNEELVVHYQPLFDPASQAVVAAEALVRWNHPLHGLLYPHAFIPQAEDSPVIHELTTFVLRQALRQRRAWADAGADVAVAVNVSPWDLSDEQFPRRVSQLLAETATPPRRLTLEITETVILHDRKQAESVLSSLKDLGVRISLDDFGTGYTSLGMVKELPIDEIKIDRSFVAELDAQDEVIIRTTAELGRRLGIVVVAEGVESQEALDTVRELGCGLVQGNFLCSPSEAVAVIRLPDETSDRGAVTLVA